MRFQNTRGINHLLQTSFVNKLFSIHIGYFRICCECVHVKHCKNLRDERFEHVAQVDYLGAEYPSFSAVLGVVTPGGRTHLSRWLKIEFNLYTGKLALGRCTGMC
jgi:hypothetical protein